MLDCKNKIWLKVQNEKKKNLIISYLFSNLFVVQGELLWYKLYFTFPEKKIENKKKASNLAKKLLKAP